MEFTVHRNQSLLSGGFCIDIIFRLLIFDFDVSLKNVKNSDFKLTKEIIWVAMYHQLAHGKETMLLAIIIKPKVL